MIVRSDPPSDAEWNWVFKSLGIGRNRRTGYYFCSYKFGLFNFTSDYRGAWFIGFYIPWRLKGGWGVRPTGFSKRAVVK